MGIKSRMKREKILREKKEEELRKVSSIEIVEVHSVMPGARCYYMGACTIFLAREMVDTVPCWHLSISCADRYPTWDEVSKARYSLMPKDINTAMFLPPKEEYVNIHKNCFHVWEVRFIEKVEPKKEQKKDEKEIAK